MTPAPSLLTPPDACPKPPHASSYIMPPRGPPPHPCRLATSRHHLIPLHLAIVEHPAVLRHKLHNLGRLRVVPPLLALVGLDEIVVVVLDSRLRVRGFVPPFREPVKKHLVASLISKDDPEETVRRRPVAHSVQYVLMEVSVNRIRFNSWMLRPPRREFDHALLDSDVLQQRLILRLKEPQVLRVGQANGGLLSHVLFKPLGDAPVESYDGVRCIDALPVFVQQ
mmetsp:Transcript_11357/g.27685  ORF Transcript_11357/g.27685 Transcript_11357/m.27685 type:complete len:224 (-) Transcript_11357:433-1104(-)